MGSGRHWLLLALSWFWLLAVLGYMIWSLTTFEGLYRWLAEWQMEQWGGYYRKWTAALPVLILGGPALAYIGYRSRLRRAADGPGPAGEARSGKRVGRITLLIGLAGIVAGAGAWLLSQSQPDGSEPARRIALGSLGSGPVPRTKVRIEGRLDPEASTQLARGGLDDRVIYYAGFRADDDAKDAPVRLFIERSTAAPEQLNTLQAFLPEQTGYLIENGVPERALEQLRARGVRIAAPHYLLETGDGSQREPYYIVAAVAGFVGFICVLVGFAALLQARRRAWLATAVRPDGTPIT